MTCGYPVMVHERLRPCGKCQACARKRRNAWVGRMLMEQTQHQETCFLTLTYGDAALPRVYHKESDLWIPTLAKSHLQKWIRSARQSITSKGLSIRYFAAGEYGTKYGRPHYHLILYGIGPTWIEHYLKWWKKGFVSAYEATPASMAYVAKYCLKGGNDPELTLAADTLPDERITTAPFRLMSRKPAIGATFAPSIGRSLATNTGHGILLDPEASLQRSVQMGSKRYPLDRTMRKHVDHELESVYNIPADQRTALWERDFPEPANEEIEKARQGCDKALRSRGTRNKL